LSIVRTLGLRATYDVRNESVCTRELGRIKQTTVGELGGAKVSLAGVAGLFYLNGWLRHVPDVSALKPTDMAKPQALRPELAKIEKFFNEGVSVYHPTEYDAMIRDMGEIKAALQSEVAQTGSPEAKNLLEAFEELGEWVTTSRSRASTVEGMSDAEYTGENLLKAVGEVQRQVRVVMQAEAEFQSATTQALAEAAPAAAEVEVTEGAAASARLGAAAAEESAAEETGVTAVRGTAGRLAGLGGPFLALLAVVGTALSAWNSTPEQRAKIAAADARAYAKQGEKIAASWASQPDATDAYVFGGDTASVCHRAATDPKFGKVVSEKMGAVEFWRAFRVSQEQKYSNYAQAYPINGSSDKLIQSAELIEPAPPQGAQAIQPGSPQGAEAL
jgi:hypothetical protein